ncbi:MAG: hypothetical protein R3A78_07490 [Polyangiales bacterium]|nr:hypothetical protein [Myxococcales bacterium]
MPVRALRRWTTCALGLALLLVAAPAAADPWVRPASPASPADEEAARELYQRGVEFVEGGQPALGLEYLGLSYEKSGAFLPLYAIAVTLHTTKEYVRAYAALRQLLHMHDELPEDLRHKATALFEDVRARVGVLVLHGLPKAEELTLRIDGRNVPDGGERPLHASVIPGARRLDAERADGMRWQWRGAVREGTEISLRPTWSKAPVTPAAPVVAVRSTPPRQSDEEGGDAFYESGWFWAAVGGTVLVVTAIVLGVTLSGDDGLEPRGGNVIEL